MIEQITYQSPGPVAKAFMEDDSFVRIIIGPFGSGKTSAAIMEVFRRSFAQAPGPDGKRRTRWAFIRNTFSDLETTTIKSWEQWCPPHFGKITWGSPITHLIDVGDLLMEVLFIPLDRPEHAKKLFSLELTGAVIDEARTVPREILDVLTGRVGRYPSRLQGGCSWYGIMCVSNPSDQEADLYKICMNPPPNWKVFRQPSGRSPEAENLMNLPKGYYDLISGGKDPEFIKVFIDGEFGFVVEGKPVYPAYRDSVHVAAEPVKPAPGLGLVIGADWGLTPAAVIGQQLPDGRINVLDEFVCDDSGIVRFAHGLTAYMRLTYPNHNVALAVGDPSGTARGPDEQTVFELMNQHSPWRWRPASTNDVTLRIEAVTAALNRMVDGKPGFQLNPGCSWVRRGFNGAYHFKKIATGNGTTYHEVPNKTAASHPHDALQYMVLGMGGADVVLNRDQRRRETRSRMADGLDYDLLGYGSTPSRPAVGVRFGPPPYRDIRR